jgi:hypothetical protein
VLHSIHINEWEFIAYTSTRERIRLITAPTRRPKMTSIGSPCGACKFLRRKCVKGCVFAPYFCHEQGAAHFAAIHKVFGASNASKLLMHLPISDRCEAAVTMSYEAQARLQDPIYGCVAHIFSLQQQVSRFYISTHLKNKVLHKWGVQFTFTEERGNATLVAAS